MSRFVKDDLADDTLGRRGRGYGHGGWRGTRSFVTNDVGCKRRVVGGTAY